jgi:hypothetical protein
LIAGLLGLGIGTGEFASGAFGSWVASAAPAAPAPVFGAAHVVGLLDPLWRAVLVSVVAVVVGLLGLLWLIAQLPKLSRTPNLQLHDDARNGTITIDADTVAGALESRLAGLEGVASSRVDIFGTADHPDVAAQLTVTPQTETPQLLTQTRDLVAADLGTALETSVDRLTVQIVGIALERPSNRQIVV